MLLQRSPWRGNDLRAPEPCPQWPETLLQFEDRLLAAGLGDESRTWRTAFLDASPAFMWAVLSGRPAAVGILIDLDLPASINLVMKLILRRDGLSPSPREPLRRQVHPAGRSCVVL